MIENECFNPCAAELFVSIFYLFQSWNGSAISNSSKL